MNRGDVKTLKEDMKKDKFEAAKLEADEKAKLGVAGAGTVSAASRL